MFSGNVKFLQLKFGISFQGHGNQEPGVFPFEALYELSSLHSVREKKVDL